MKLRYKVGDRVELPHLKTQATVVIVCKRSAHLMGDRLYVSRDDEVLGTGKDGLWITNAYSVRETTNAKG